MNRLFKTIVLATAAAATTLVPVMEASAGERYRGDYRRHYDGRHHDYGRYHRDRRHDERRDHGRKKRDSGDLIAAGILGLAAGALIVGATSAAGDRGPDGRYPLPDQGFDPWGPRPGYRPPNVVHSDPYGGIEPWTRDWYRYCQNRYRSFNPQTGTFRGYDGRDHFCVAR